MIFESGIHNVNPATSLVTCRMKVTIPAGNLKSLADCKPKPEIGKVCNIT